MRLNELYTEDFGEDSDLFSLWLEMYTKVKEQPGDPGYCALVIYILGITFVTKES